MSLSGRGRVHITIAVAVVLVGIGARFVAADPVGIQSGVYAMTEDGGSALQLFGDGLNVVSRGDRGSDFIFPGSYWTQHCACMAGSSLELSSDISGALGWSHQNSTTVSGVTFASPVYFSGDLRFEAPTVTLPTTQGTTIFDEPFTFTGQLLGFDNAALSGMPLFDIPLTGAGNFRGGVVANPSGRFEPISGFQYAFTSSPSPAPEPESLVLLATGLLGIVVPRVRRRVRRA